MTVWGRAVVTLGHCPGHASVAATVPTSSGLGALDSWERSRRDAGLCGASLSADVPLAGRVAHMFFSCQGVLDASNAVQISVIREEVAGHERGLRPTLP